MPEVATACFKNGSAPSHWLFGHLETTHVGDRRTQERRPTAALATGLDLKFLRERARQIG